MREIRNLLIIFASLFALALITSCAPASDKVLSPPPIPPQDTGPKPPAVQTQPTATPPPTRAPVAKKPKPPRKPKPHRQPHPEGPSTFARFHQAAVWAKVPGTEAWTKTVLRALNRLREDLEEARDLEQFCPEYSQASKFQRNVCWLRLISAVAKFESSFNPQHRYLEPMGMYSIGLMQLSDGECILNGDPRPNLANASNNLKCAMAMMAKLIRRDRYIDGPLWARGAGAYWSTLRRPYIFLGMRLGKKNKVVKHTRAYRSF